MKKRQTMKGFTLIELLAVIVILAIIVLIAVPVIMNIMNSANKSAFKDTAYGIISAGELYFAEQQLDVNGMIEDETINLSDTTNTLGLKGEIPEGSITISKEGKTALAVYNGRYCITKGFNDKDIIVTEDYEECKLPKGPNPNISSTSACVTSGTCSEDEIKAGILVNVKVNDKKDYDFYVVSDTGTELTLIMDRNIGNTVAWASRTDYNDDNNYGEYGNTNKGPITALNYLNSQTADWTNIGPIENYTYDNSLNDPDAYQKIVITNGVGMLTSQDEATTTTLIGVSRARLLTKEEIILIPTGFSYPYPSKAVPTWMTMNLEYNTTLNFPSRYWLLSSYASPYGPEYASVMEIKQANLGVFYGIRTNLPPSLEAEHLAGVRPVITISK